MTPAELFDRAFPALREWSHRVAGERPPHVLAIVVQGDDGAPLVRIASFDDGLEFIQSLSLLAGDHVEPALRFVRSERPDCTPVILISGDFDFPGWRVDTLHWSAVQ